MTGAALGLVLTSACLHALWNLLSKRISGGGAVTIWMFSMVATLVYLPLGVGTIVQLRPAFGWGHLGMILLSASIHITYFIFLTRGYRSGDLSVVYPLARGSGPLLSLVAAVILLGERPTPIALAGAALIGVGVVVLTGDPRKLRDPKLHSALLYALLTGLTIAAYTIVDKFAVGIVLIPPLLFDWISSLMRSTLLAPYAWTQRPSIKELWRTYRWQVIGIGVLSPLSYILMLTALSFSPVSYVAPAREIAILFGALLGVHILGEGDARRRAMAAAIMVSGVVALALG